MSRASLLPVSALFSVLLIACNVGPHVTGSGEIISEGREVAPFSHVEVDGATDVIITYGSTQNVTVIADDNIVPIIRTEVSGETLRIEPDEPYSSSTQVRVEIVVPIIRSVDVEGSSDIEVRGVPIEADGIDSFTLEIDGSGDAEIDDMRAERVDIDIEGSGGVRLGGRGEVLEIVVEGSGDVDALDFEAEEGIARIEGSGEIRINVVSILRATISGSGSILYRGNPTILEKTISGSGEIRTI